MMTYVLVKIYLQKLTLCIRIPLYLVVVIPVRTFDKSQETYQWNVIQALQIMEIVPAKTLQCASL